MPITDRTGSAIVSSETTRQAGLASSVSRKGPCVACSTTNVTLSGEQTVDGIAVLSGQRVLLAGQDDATENGIWYVSTGDWERAPDFSRNDDVIEGTEIRVTRGTNAGVWVVTTQSAIEIGTTEITIETDAAAVANALLAANNLSDLGNKMTAWVNLQGTSVTIASAATVNLSDPLINTGTFVTISGSTGISAFTMNAEQVALVRFSGSPLITVSSSLVGNNGGVNMQMEAGDMALLKKVGTTVYFTHLPVRDRNNSKWSAAVSSAGTVSLPEGKYGHITGTTTITDVDFAVAVDGKWALVEFDSALTITHSSTLKCPGNSNMAISAGDTVIFVQDDGDTVRVIPLYVASMSSGGGSVVSLVDDWIPAGAFVPQLTNGPSVGVVEISTSLFPMVSLDYDTSTAEKAHTLYRLPKRWNGGTITVEVVWTAASGSGGVAWGISGLARGDDDALATAYGTQVVVTDTFITANDIHITTTSAAITFGGSPQDADILLIAVERLPSNGSDTLGVDAKFLGLVIHYTASADTDA